jgi:hypothetical protein
MVGGAAQHNSGGAIDYAVSARIGRARNSIVDEGDNAGSSALTPLIDKDAIGCGVVEVEPMLCAVVYCGDWKV